MPLIGSFPPLQSIANSAEVNRDPSQPQKTFSYSFGLVVSCLGCVLGTGNIWRFPRIIAMASTESGSLTFLLAWAFFLFAWSIPLVIEEYTLGRFTKASPTVAFYKFLGSKFLWVGSWVTAVAFFIRLVI